MQVPLTRGLFAIVDAADYEYVMQWKWYATSAEPIYAVRAKTHITGTKVTIPMHRLIYSRMFSDAPSRVPHSSSSRMHRLIYSRMFSDGRLVDHANGDSLDNRRANLRPCDAAQNARNVKARSNTSSAYKGVSWHAVNKKWVAYISVDGGRIYLGSFRHEEMAAGAYNSAASRYHGEFARLNTISCPKP